MTFNLQDLADYLKCDPREIRTLLKKLGAKNKKQKPWRISPQLARKVIKASHLLRATKLKNRKYLNLKDLNFTHEPIPHNKPKQVFKKYQENNQMLP